MKGATQNAASVGSVVLDIVEWPIDYHESDDLAFLAHGDNFS
jgi:hypothetical protein